jgi:16S rRNA (guanine966-N2)-methyltransferase
LRIIRGILKSRRFSVPKGFPSRPTTDFAKEGLFNILENKFSLQDLQILDLCAGTGSISFEFASREAGKITAIDQNFNCVKWIKNCAKEFQIEHAIDVFRADVKSFLMKTEQRFDLIFADPPYSADIHETILNLIFERNLLETNGLIIIEHGKETDLSHLNYFDGCRSYGNVYFSFFTQQDNR